MQKCGLDTYHKVLNHYGEEHQIKKTIEELRELRLELYRHLRGFGNREAIISEMADVCNMLTQLMIIFDIDDVELYSECDKKMERQLERIEKGEG